MDHDTQRQDTIVRNVTPPQVQAILHAFDGKSELSTHEIYECVSTHFPDLSRLEHGILLGKLKQEGMIAPGPIPTHGKGWPHSMMRPRRPQRFSLPR